MSDVDEAIHLFFRAVDARDWDTVRAGLAPEVRLDYSSLFRGDPEVLPSPDVVERWRGLLPGFDATMHLLGPLVSAEGVLQCNVRGYHHLDGDTWMVAGWYTFDLDRFAAAPRIAGIRLQTSYETGSRELVEQAQARAEAAACTEDQRLEAR